MIAVSSHRPHAGCAEEIKDNQRNAKRTWDSVFDCVVYYGPFEPELSSNSTFFVASDPFPKISELASLCGTFNGWSCIINSDIVVRPTFSTVIFDLQRIHAKSATSFRLEFDPENDNIHPRKTDMGLDIFCANSDVWSIVSRTIPDFYRIGHGGWDNWMAGFFHLECQPSYDFSPSQCILHPKHEHRLRPFLQTIRPDKHADRYSASARPPMLKLNPRVGVDISRNKENR
jgi:hypothetical protein